jgi:Tol biopolymer transport system component
VVEIRSQRGTPIRIDTGRPQVRIPEAEWHSLLQQNPGAPLTFDVWRQDVERHWQRFAPISNSISADPVDPYLVYRLIKPLYNVYRDVGIYQRDLRTFRQSEVFHGRSFADGCVNCHAFPDRSTNRMAVGMRSGRYGNAVLLAEGDKVTKIGNAWGYTSWHPNGRLVAYSLNKVRQFFHPVRPESRDVVDLDSDIFVYSIGEKSAQTTPALSDPNRLETYPTWSPDGKWLYFCSAPILWTDRETVPPAHFDEVRYDLRRVAYDPQTGKWGDCETVISGQRLGKSVLLPRISPDGRFLLVCMCKYGCFPIFQPDSDLWVMDLKTAALRRLEINSDWSESWHSWSRNSRWIAFSSKRNDGLFTRTYLSHVDPSGVFSKPLLVPQEDPNFYDSCLYTYSVPEFVTEPVQASARALAAAARSEPALTLEMPVTSMTPSKKKQPNDTPWQGRP